MLKTKQVKVTYNTVISTRYSNVIHCFIFIFHCHRWPVEPDTWWRYQHPVGSMGGGRMVWVNSCSTLKWWIRLPNWTWEESCKYWKSPLYRDQSRYAPSQWETSLQCNDVSHWLGAFLDWSLLNDILRKKYEHGSRVVVLCVMVNLTLMFQGCSGIILYMCPANERRRNIVMSSH